MDYTKRSPKSVFGYMNMSLSVPDPQADERFHGPAPAVIEDVPTLDRELVRSLTLVDFSKPETSGGIRLCRTESGRPVGLWADPNGYRNVFWPTVEQDFTPYTHLEFWMYSAHPTGARFSFELRGPWDAEKAPGEPPYFRFEIVLNYQGWKHFEIPLSALDAHFGGKLECVTHIGLHATNWENDMYAVRGSFVYFDTVELTVRKSDYTPDESLVTPRWLDIFRTRWQESLVGNDAINLTSPLAHELAVAQGRHGADRWKQMNKAPDAPCLWGEYTDMREGHHVQMHTEGLFYMARAWATPGSEYYHNEELLADINYGLDWIWERGYGANYIPLGPTGNWWQWSIGIPIALVRCMILIYDTLTPERIKHLLVAVDHMDYYPRMTQANRIWIAYCAILAALLENDVPRLTECIRRMQTVFGYVTYGDGFYEDGSFIQHTNSPYIGGYGSTYLSEIVNFFYVFRESPLALSQGRVDELFHYFFSAFSPFMYKGVMLKSVCGRNLLGDGLSILQITSMMKMVPLATEEQRAKLFALVREYCESNDRFREKFPRQLPFICVPYYEALMATHPGRVEPFTRIYGAMDRGVSRHDEYCASLAYSTSRIARYESINGQNQTGWYQAEGSLCVVKDDLYAYDGEFYRYSDPHRFPGTTVTDVVREPHCCVFLTCGTYAYGGGVDSGVHGFAATHIGYRAFNFPWLLGFESDLDLRKAWFFFDGGILCMNAGITCTDDHKVLTVIDNRKLSADAERNRILFDGTEQALTGEDTVYGPVHTVYNPELGSYVFYGATPVVARVQSEEHPFFELYVDHGVKPVDASLVYAILPGADASKSAEFAKNPTVRVLSNTPSVMAAEDTVAGVKAYAFFEAGAFDGISVSTPATLMTKAAEAGLEVSVSDPTHYETELVLRFAGRRRLVADDGSVSASYEDGETVVTVCVNGTVGKTHRFTLS